jgi:hypothetical protein
MMGTDGPERGRGRSFPWGSIMLAVASVIMTLAALEIALRVTHVFGAHLSVSTPDSLLGWRFVPGSSYWEMKENDHPITGTINSWGWRDREWAEAKPPGTIRVAVLGDSYVEGMQVESDSTFPRLAERAVNARYGITTEWMNFGRSSCTQTEEWLILQNDVARFHPDIVIVVFFPLNDVDDVSRELTEELRPFFEFSADGTLTLDTQFAHSREYHLRKLIEPLKRNSAVVSLLLERYRLLQFMAGAARTGRSSFDELPRRSISSGLTLCTATPDPAALRAYRINKALLRAMVGFCRERSIRFMLVSTELPTYVPEVEQKILAGEKTFNSMFFDDDMNAFADSLGIAFLGLHRRACEFYKEHGVHLSWPTDIQGGHWNYQGHRFVADQIQRKMESVLYLSYH